MDRQDPELSMFLGDRPIDRASADGLDRGAFVSSLVSTLIRPVSVVDGRIVGRSATGFVVGLTGEWGSGKSSVLNLVAEELDGMPFTAVARLNPWLFRGRDELVAAYFNALRSALGRSAGEIGRDLATAVDRYRSSIETLGTVGAAIGDAHGGGGWFKWAWSGAKKAGRAVPVSKARTPDEERAALEGKLRRLGVAVVVLIDELDRVEDDEVRAVAQLVKAVGDIAGVSYLVAYDPDRVADALGRGSDPAERRRSGEAYLEKIVQYAIPVRPLFREDADRLLATALAQAGAAVPDRLDEDRKELFDAVLRVVRTPREVKRLVGTFAVLDAAVQGEIDPVDVLGYAWIAIKAPNLRARIARDFERLVDDPSQEEMMRRLHQRRSGREAEVVLADELGPAADAHAEVLALMFPRFRKDRRGRPDGHRVAHRRNIVRLLYLGNPPGMVAREDVERLWSTENREVLERELAALLEGGTLRSLLGRLGDLAASLSRDREPTFWIALSRTLERDSDWAWRFDDRRAAIDDASELLLDWGKDEGAGRKAVLRAIDALIAAGDLLIVPFILRRHLFAHGLTVHGRSRNGDTILDSGATAALFDRELPRYRQAILDGRMLRRVPDVELLFSILNMGKWDGELSASLTGQLDGPEPLATFASIMLPQGWSVDHSTLAELFDVEIVGSRLNALLADGWMHEDEWVADAVRRLERRLALPGADAGTIA